ncbi:cytochrome c oxidase subunit 3 [Salinigranum halophilum]|jgi:cytochrome c oxidase subunit 3|uniref:cytochrome c oxidase subunit 3 n=1 Tax=Salinigranum halophilum TaxID=2565931 RepID=UPI0010A7B029|nr:heme-copper oxidase subunit III [Salinigranum halophilum]
MDGTDVATHGEHDAGGGQHQHRSRWPIVAAVGAAALYGGVGLLLGGGSLVPRLPLGALAAVGGVVLAVGLVGWAYEAFVADYWATQVDRSDLYVGGMVLFLISDVATFAAGFVYYAFVRVGPWPPSELPPLVGSLVLVNTLILVVSSATIHRSHGALEAGDRTTFIRWLAVTVGLGVVFVGGQVYEYYEFVTHEAFTLSGGVFASAFYGLTGLHGLHVSLGVVLLGSVLVRALRGQYTDGRDAGVRTVALYWHFVDVVWLFLVVVLYVGAVVG